MIALAALLAATLAPRTDACMNEVLATDEAIAAVKEAEKVLDDGDPAKARKGVLKALGGASEFKESTPSSKGLTNRARRILSLAFVRLDPDGHGPEVRKTLLDQAVATLEKLAKASPNDAAKRTDLGEALAKTKPAEARKILEDLAKLDVVTTPYAYAALARLRAASGDTKGRDEAIARCKPMAKVGAICKLAPSGA
jgi:hypothetical protein